MTAAQNTPSSSAISVQRSMNTFSFPSSNLGSRRASRPRSWPIPSQACQEAMDSFASPMRRTSNELLPKCKEYTVAIARWESLQPRQRTSLVAADLQVCQCKAEWEVAWPPQECMEWALLLHLATTGLHNRWTSSRTQITQLSLLEACPATSLRMSFDHSSRASERLPTSKSPRERAAVSFSSFNAMLRRWLSTRCRAILSETLAFVCLGDVLRITLVPPAPHTVLHHHLLNTNPWGCRQRTHMETSLFR